METQYYTTTQAASKLGVSVDTVKRMCSDGRLNGVEQTSTKRLIPVAEVHKYLVPAEQAAEVEAAAMARWSDRRKANGNYSHKNRSTSINTTLQK